MDSETSLTSEPEDAIQPYVPGHAWVLTFASFNGQDRRLRVCYHCGAEEDLAPRACYANEEWTVIE